ncbi:MAG: efflux RND transporter periplasmic adaptor subunit, partial [Hymenobacter sp.]
MRNYLTTVAAGLLALSLAACGGKKKDEAQKGPPKIQTYPVLQLRPDTVTLYQDYPATIQGKQNVEIRPKLVARNIISKYELEGAQYTLESKQAALAQARATLANALTNLGYTTITSPVSGVVGTIPNKIGALVSSTSTDPLTTVSGTADVYAYFSLSEKALLSFVQRRPGATLQDKLANLPNVRLVLANGAVYQYPGRVKTAIGQVDTETGASTFRATFPNPGGLLRSGGSGSVRTLQ